MIDRIFFAAMVLNNLELKGGSKKEDTRVIVSGLKIAFIRNKTEYIKGSMMIIPKMKEIIISGKLLVSSIIYA